MWKYVEAFNRGDVDAVCGLFAPDAQIWGVMGCGSARAGAAYLEGSGGVPGDEACGGRHGAGGRRDGGSAVNGAGPLGQGVSRDGSDGQDVRGYGDGVVRGGRRLIRRRWGARHFSAMSQQLGFGD